YGLLVNIENVGDAFLESHFGSSDGSFFKCSPAQDQPRNTNSDCKKKIFASLEYEAGVDCYLSNYELKSEAGWDDLIELTRVLNEKPEEVETVLNVDRTLWMLAFNNALVNLNSYTGQNSQNYYLYMDSTGQFNPIIWDLNLAFGSYKNTGVGSDLNLRQLQELDPLLHVDNVAKPLLRQLLANPNYKKIYLAHLRTILYDHFVDESFAKRTRELQRLISSDMFEDPNKQYQHNDFLVALDQTIGKRSKIPGLLELMVRRGRYLKKHPELSGIPPEISDVDVMRREKYSNVTVDKFRISARVEKRAKKVRLYYRFDSKAPYQMVFMNDNGKSNDGQPGDKVFGVEVDPAGAADTIEYFIVAENAVAISYYPNNYMFAPVASSLQQLNQ
ncbi:MAG: CotH kinase family protein, partial [Bacteroidota bacterium]